MASQCLALPFLPPVLFHLYLYIYTIVNITESSFEVNEFILKWFVFLVCFLFCFVLLFFHRFCFCFISVYGHIRNNFMNVEICIELEWQMLNITKMYTHMLKIHLYTGKFFRYTIFPIFRLFSLFLIHFDETMRHSNGFQKRVHAARMHSPI